MALSANAIHEVAKPGSDGNNGVDTNGGAFNPANANSDSDTSPYLIVSLAHPRRLFRFTFMVLFLQVKPAISAPIVSPTRFPDHNLQVD